MSTEQNSSDSQSVFQNSRKIQKFEEPDTVDDGDVIWGWQPRGLKICLRSSEIPFVLWKHLTREALNLDPSPSEEARERCWTESKHEMKACTLMGKALLIPPGSENATAVRHSPRREELQGILSGVTAWPQREDSPHWHLMMGSSAEAPGFLAHQWSPQLASPAPVHRASNQLSVTHF